MLKFLFFCLFILFIIYDFYLTIIFISISFFFIIFCLKFSIIEYFLYNFFINRKFSLGLIFLTFYIIFLFFLSINYVEETKDKKYFIIISYFILIILLFCFNVSRLFVFYIFFESSLIPIYLIIIGWGYQPERLKASLYIFFYTIFFSLPLIILMFYIYKIKSNNFNFFMIYNIFYINLNILDILIYLCFTLAFLVKLPLFFLHIWLPKAHVEAPVGGSIVLARILLKLGLYGIYRMLFLINYLNYIIKNSYICFSLLGGLIASIICLYQYDLKVLIAYSSVAHIGITIASLITLRDVGISGAYSISLAHGFCSSGLFFLSYCNYKRHRRRRFFINKGLLNFTPYLILFWFFFCIINISVPPFLRIFSEIIIIISIISFSFIYIIIIFFILFFSCVYSIYLFSIITHGRLNKFNYSIIDGLIIELFILFLHFIPLFFLIFLIDFSLLII